MTPVEFRRRLHAHPELSFREDGTAAFIAEQLAELGIEHRTIARTGILARIPGRRTTPGDRRAVVLRADIDALPIAERTGLAYSSRNAGVMHACGHDVHAAVLFGVLQRLAADPDFSGTLLGLFQPGEECNPGGASLVLAEDPFREYDIRAVIGEHVEPQLEVGTLGFRAGKYMAASDELRLRVRGTGGHGALRSQLRDPVAAGAELLTRLVALNGEECVLSVGRVQADGATNVVPDRTFMEGTMRTFDETWRRRVKKMVHEAAAEVDARFGVSTEVDINHGYPCVYNDEELTRRVESATAGLFGEDAVISLGLRPTAEDFGYYTLEYPSVYYRLGVGGDGAYFDSRSAGRIHTGTFRPDEKALGYGVVQFINIVFTVLG